MDNIYQDLKRCEKNYETSLRPDLLNEFTGQQKIRDQLSISVQAALMRKEPLDHILFCGPPGLGKTTLAYIMANQMKSSIKTSSGPVIDKPGDLAGLLTSLEKGDILFIDEIHRLNSVVEEYLYSAMEDRFIDIMIDKGAHARSVRIELEPFTLIGATTRSGLLTAPLRSRFGITMHLNYYNTDEISTIIKRSARILKIRTDDSGAEAVALRSRGTPRIANNLLKRVRDYVMVKGFKELNKKAAEESLNLLDIDHKGLEPMDIKILKIIIDNYQGGPVGLSTIAVACGEEADTLEEVYEPFLIMSGFIKRTSQGRVATDKAYQHLKRSLPGLRQELF